MKGFLFVFNSKEYKKSENVVVCISNSKSLTARFAKAYVTDAMLSPNSLPQGSQRTPLRRLG